jgi:hypothetical protein
VDDDCDGSADEDYIPTFTCGAGACEADSTCSGGTEICMASPPTGDDSDCDDVDDDCDGLVDEHYTPYTCGLGLCEENSVCVGGVATCTAGTPSGPDDTCNGVDEDCDGLTDEHWVAGTCGLGVCEATETCVAGVEDCTPGSPTGADDDCNGIDEDCDGTPDDGWVSYTCGVDACAGTATCVAGAEDCTPAPAGTSCNDGVACTHTDVCDTLGGCAGTMYACPMPGTCEDSVSCDGLGGCLTTYSSAGTSCTDPWACTETDQCDGLGTCEGTPNDSLCSSGELCRPECFPSSGCGTEPGYLDLDCPDTRTLPADASCTIDLDSVAGQAGCIACDVEVGQVVLSRTTFDGTSGCGIDGWTMTSGSLCYDSVTSCTPSGGGRSCCATADSNVLRNIGGDCRLRTMRNGNCGGGYEEWQITRTHDFRGLSDIQVCFRIADWDATTNEGILLYAEDSTHSTRVFCLNGPPVQGPIPVDGLEWPYCVSLPSWAEDNGAVTLRFIGHSESFDEALYLDDIVVRAWSDTCAPTRSTVFSEDFEPCPVSNPIPNGWNGWTVAGLGGPGSGPDCGNWCSGGTGGARVDDDEWIMTHAVDASTLDGDVRLCFDVGDSLGDWNEWIAADFDATGTGSSWQEAWYWENEWGSDGTCTQVCVNLSDIDPSVNNNPDLLIRFWLSSNTPGERVFLDDVFVDGAVYCPGTGLASIGSISDLGGGSYSLTLSDDVGRPLGAHVTCSWDTPPAPVLDRDTTWFRSP